MGQTNNQGGTNAQAAAGNYNSATLFDTLSSSGGSLQSILQGLYGGGGTGGQTSYASYLANNPNSMAAVGQGAYTPAQ